MDACVNCPYVGDCILDPNYKCFLDQTPTFVVKI